jgi:hypothetical protein
MGVIYRSHVFFRNGRDLQRPFFISQWRDLTLPFFILQWA